MEPSATGEPGPSPGRLIDPERPAPAGGPDPDDPGARDPGAGDPGAGDPGRDDPGEDDPEIVLPWWQHPVNIVTLVVTAALLAGMIGWLVGDSGGRPAHDDVDTGFLQDMRYHHDQAVLMGLIFAELPDTQPGLRTVARSIVRGQSIEIGRMVQLLRDFGESEVNDTGTAMAWMGMPIGIDEMPGLASDDDLDRLAASSGTEADRLFVELMVAHHEGGIEMAEHAAEHARSGEVRLMASSMATAQRSEIVEMQDLVDPGAASAGTPTDAPTGTG